MKDDLPRIQYVNPTARIEVNKVPKSKTDTWKPEMVMELGVSPPFMLFHLVSDSVACQCYTENGKSHTIDLSQKWSSTIFTEIMDLAGGPSWTKWKRERKELGLPPVDVPLAKPKVQAQAEPSKREKKKGEAEPAPEALDYHALFDTKGKTGAAAVLP